MYAKIVVSVVLVSILPCESQHQRFLAVPFEDNDESISKPHESQQLIHNNHFVTEKSHRNGDLHANLRRNKNFFANSIVSNTEPQLNINQEHFNNNFGRILDGQGTHTSTIDQQQLQRFPTGEDFTINQPIQMFGIVENQDPTSALTQQIQQNNENHRELLSSIIRSKEPPAKPINAFLSVEEPVLTVIEEPKTINPQTPSTRSQQGFSLQARSQFPQQLHTQVSFMQPLISQQIVQPQIHDHISSHLSHQTQQIHQQFDSHPIVQQPLLHISQQTQPQFPSQTPRPAHRPRILRPASRNNHQRVNLNPQVSQQPEFIINVQPNVIATPVHRFASQQNTESNLRVQGDSNSISRRKTNRDFEEEIFRQQAENAKYSFASQIDDSINGNQHQREEVRDGVDVKGMYSYSDGYVKRTVFYEADDKGYRVVKEEEEPLGDGPQFNPRGQANVSSFVAGNAVQYSITSDDIQKQNPALSETTSI